MTRDEHQKIAAIISVSPISKQCKRRLLITFCNHLAGEGLEFRRDEFVRQSSNGLWANFHSLRDNVETKKT